MKKPFLILSLLFALSCSTDKVPENVLGKDKMANVLLEVHLLESKIQKLYLPADSAKVVYKHYEKMLFTDLGIDEKTYNESLVFYVDHSELLGEVYNQVVDSLMLRHNTLDY